MSMQEILNDLIEFVFTLVIYLFVAELALMFVSKIIAFLKTQFDHIDVKFLKRSGKR